MNLQKNKFALSLAVALVIACALSALFYAGFLSPYNIQLADRLYGGKIASEDIVIIGIDDRSLQEIGRWPWDRSVHAALLDKISGHPAIVVFDVSFFEPSPDDGEMERAINDSGNVVLVSEYSFSGNSTDFLVPVFNANYGMGFANIFPGVGGTVRSLPPAIEGEKPLSVAVSEYLLEKQIDLGGTELLINYVGPPGSFARYSYADVLNGTVDPALLDDRIVLIGATAEDLRDVFLTPVSGQNMPGVEVHANAMQTILTGDFLEHQDKLSVMVIIFAICLFLSLVLYRHGVFVSTVAALGIGVIYFIAAVKMFSWGMILNLVYPILAIVCSYVAYLAFFYAHETRQRKMVTNIFGKYVSKEVAKEILEKTEADEIDLKGQKREITVFFSDIRGFTTLSEKLTPEGLVDFLNKYLSAMTDVILGHRGIVDKYIGDAIMAFWGAPLKEKQHAKLACEACLAQKKKLEDMKIEGLAVGMGLNTGLAIVGNMGSLQRVNYTAIGDVVNTASRLEGMTKEYGVSIIIGEATHAQVHRDFICRELDMIKVKGKNIPVRIYELVGREADDKTMQMIAHYHEGLRLYRKGKWNAAAAEFRKSVKAQDNKAARLFLERCDYLRKHRPKKWDGVWTMTHK